MSGTQSGTQERIEKYFWEIILKFGSVVHELRLFTDISTSGSHFVQYDNALFQNCTNCSSLCNFGRKLYQQDFSEII